MEKLDADQWQTLKGLGLTDNEVRTYLALLEQGATTVGPLVPKTQMHRSRVYASLERLVEKGFVSVIRKSQKHIYQALAPESLLEMLEEKKRGVTELLPALSAMATPSVLSAAMYEGIPAMKAVRMKLLSEMKAGETLLVQGAPSLGNKRIEAWYLEFHRQRERKGVNVKILYNADARQYGEKRLKLFKRLQCRYMEEKTVTPAWVDVFSDSIMIVVFKPPVISFVVKDRGLRDSFAAFFDVLWKNAARR
ncbi:BlaI/MecI/CopY family transcriptional regulator [Candidatus Micrarchaeota archaeon]|nr:BlaI/MecI/CopY family transcriptional regulator [Candidatus Micrarchaeota archaeon]